jgi:type I restriction enzyme, S subunit
MPFTNSAFPLVALGHVAEVRLGKMLQPASIGAADQETPYLRAGHISNLRALESLPTMFASSADQAIYGVVKGDLIVAEGGDAGRTAFVPDIPADTIIQNSLHRVRPTRAEPRFVKYALDAIYASGWLDVVCNKSTFGHLTREKLVALRVPAPPLPEQRIISDKLDAKTARIDALVQKKRRMIDLLEMRWHTNVRDRLSDLGPRMSLRRRWRVTDCKHRTPAYVSQGYPVTSPGDLSPGRIDLTRCHRFVDDVDFRDLTEGRRPKRGDVIYSRNASAGIAAYVDTDQPFCMGQDVCLITSSEQDQRFLMYALNTIGVDQLAPIKIGSTITRINVDQIGELTIPVPPMETQRQIADALDYERERIDRLVQCIRHQIGLLREHRQALITAAVTGDLDIDKAAA